MTNRLKKWVRTNNIIPVEQSGFQQRRTTQDVLANITQSAMDNLQAKKRTIVAAVDFRAAFDRVWRGGLLRDMARLNLHPVAVKWLQSFLRDRRAVVRWEDKTSRCRSLKEGVPQGSPLSPLLFCIATAGLPGAIKAMAPSAEVDQFADDLTVCTEDTTVEGAAKKCSQLSMRSRYGPRRTKWRLQQTKRRGR